MNDIRQLVRGGLTPVKETLSYLNGGDANLRIVEFWEGPTTWFRRWSNGWLEQGGTDTAFSWGRTFTFPRAFSDANYFAYVSTSNDGSQQWYITHISSKTRTSMTVGSHNAQITYYCCGW